MSQNQRIRAALLRGERITALTAFRKWGCLRLGGRIFELRQSMKIRAKAKRVGRKIVAEYSLA